MVGINDPFAIQQLLGLERTKSNLDTSLRQLSSGLRVNRAADDVAALAQASRLSGDIVEIQAARQNTAQAAAFLDIAEGTASSIDGLVTRAKELAVQASNGTLSRADRDILNNEFQSVVAEIDRLSADSKFNDESFFNDNATVTLDNAAAGISGASATGLEIDDPGVVDNLSFDADTNTFSVTIDGQTFSGEVVEGAIDESTGELQAGTSVRLTSDTAEGAITLQLDEGFDTTADIADAGDLQIDGTSTFDKEFRIGAGGSAIDVDIAALNSEALGLDSLDVTSIEGAEAAISALDAAATNVTAARAELGAVRNTVSSAQDSLAVAEENIQAARSEFIDADIAKSASEKAAANALLQANLATLAQGNSAQRNVLLSLLAG